MQDICFDVDGVLIHGYHADPIYRKRWDLTLEQDLGITQQDLVEGFFIPLYGPKVQMGQMDVLEALQQFLQNYNYDVSAETFFEYWLEKDATINQPLVDLAGKLHARDDVRVYITTNQEHRRATYLWEQLGFKDFAVDIFYSGKLGVTKPDQAFFQAVDDVINPANPPLLFDDTPEVIKAAKAHGWQAQSFRTMDDVLSHPVIKPLLG